MSRRAALLALLLLGLVLAAPLLAADTLVIVVRHAEKADNDPRDPDLSAAGQLRAVKLAQVMAGSPPAAVYATPFRRTRQTAMPTAEASGVGVTSIDAPAEQHGDLLRERILRDHRGQTVLVVGHSNTVPQIVATLAGRDAPAMADDEYDRFSLVVLPEQGEPCLLVSRY